MQITSLVFDLIFRGDATLWSIIGLSLRVSISACLIAAVIGIPLGTVLAMIRFRGRGVLITVLNAFMALPPVVVGLTVYLLLSRAGPLGHWGLLFTPSAMVIAQSILIFPIITALTLEAVRPLQRNYDLLLNAFDVPAGLRLRLLIVDARFAISTAVLAGFGRAIAEVGAVLIVGGNIAGVTRVMTTTIALETAKGNLELALALGLVLISIAVLINALMQVLRNIGQRYQVAAR